MCYTLQFCFWSLSLTCLFKFSISCFSCWSVSLCLSLLYLVRLQTLQVFILSRVIEKVFSIFIIRSSVVYDAVSCCSEAVTVSDWFMIVVIVMSASSSLSCTESEMLWIKSCSLKILWDAMLLAVRDCWHFSYITQIIYWLHSVMMLMNLQYSMSRVQQVVK